MKLDDDIEEFEALVAQNKSVTWTEPEAVFVELTEEAQKPVWFVDGGNHAFFNYAYLVAELNRVFAVCYSALDYVGALGPYNFLSFTFVEGGEVKTKLYHRALEFLEKQLENREIRKGEVIANLTGRARRVAELRLARHLVEREGAEIVVLDGNFSYLYDTAELKELTSLLSACHENGASLVGFAKKTTLSKKGRPITQYVEQIMRKQGKDFYWVKVGEAKRGQNPSYNTKLFVAKLNSSAQKPYLVEVFSNSSNRVLEVLTLNSSSVQSPGYPLGLVHADRVARIRTQIEGELVKLKLIRLAKSSEQLAGVLQEAYSHDLLDALNS